MSVMDEADGRMDGQDVVGPARRIASIAIPSALLSSTFFSCFPLYLSFFLRLSHRG